MLLVIYDTRTTIPSLSERKQSGKVWNTEIERFSGNIPIHFPNQLDHKQFMDYTTFSEKQSTLDKRKRTLKLNPTKSEIRIKSLLKDIKIRAMFQKGFIAGKNFCIVDFYIPMYTLVLEIDGGYHLTPEQIARDKNRDWYLNQRKISVLHITNEIADTILGEELKAILLKHKKTKGFGLSAYIK